MVANCARSGFRLWVFSILTLNDEIIITELATEMLDGKIYPEIRGCCDMEFAETRDADFRILCKRRFSMNRRRILG